MKLGMGSRVSWLLVLTAQFGYTSTSLADGFLKKLLPDLNSQSHASQELHMGEFVNDSQSAGLINMKWKGTGLGLNAPAALSTDDLLKSVLKNNKMGYGHFNSSTSLGLTGGSDGSNRKVHVLTSGTLDFCETYYVLTMDNGDDQPYYMAGFLPPSAANVTVQDEQPEMGESWSASRSALDGLLVSSTGKWTEVSKKPCIWLENNESRKAWMFEMAQDETSFRVIAAGNTVLKVKPTYFHVDGKITSFPNNNKDTKLQKFTVTDLKDPGKLSNNFFYVVPYGVADDKGLVKADNNFSFPVDSPEFKQATLFANVNRVLDWFFDNGYSQFGSERIRVLSQAVIKGDVNNAVYKPAYADNPPSIYVGDGDGTHLANLNLDMDVVSHEFGHHVIFRTIQETEGESAVLHEGIADFFTFLRTGDACLGESICPLGSTSCYVPNRCLRTAENDIVLGGPKFPQDDHLRGQLISGFMWDLKTRDGISDRDMMKLALKALDYQGAKSSYRMWILGMLYADKDLFKGGNCTAIRSRALERGFKTQMQDVNCAGNLPDPNSAGVSSGKSTNDVAAAAAVTEEKKKKDQFGCSIGLNAPVSSHWLWLSLLAFPIAMHVGRPVYARVRRPSSKIP